MEKKVPDRVENIVRKGEIACNKQFLLFSQCFPQIYLYFSASNAEICGNGLNTGSCGQAPCKTE